MHAVDRTHTYRRARAPAHTDPHNHNHTQAHTSQRTYAYTDKCPVLASDPKHWDSILARIRVHSLDVLSPQLTLSQRTYSPLPDPPSTRAWLKTRPTRHRSANEKPTKQCVPKLSGYRLVGRSTVRPGDSVRSTRSSRHWHVIVSNAKFRKQLSTKHHEYVCFILYSVRSL